MSRNDAKDPFYDELREAQRNGEIPPVTTKPRQPAKPYLPPDDMLTDMAPPPPGPPGRPPLPTPVTLAEFLAMEDEPFEYRIEGLLPVGGRAIVAAQFKAGKTTMVDNLVRSFCDGDDFLDKYPTMVRRVTLIDDEMDARQIRRWLRKQGIRNQTGAKVLTLRGSVSCFNIMDPEIRAQWAEKLRGTEVLIFDCLRPVLDALGMDESHDAGKFLVAFDALLKEAGIAEAILIHHMGHVGERSRGDSRLRDWPDVEWRLVRQASESGDDDPNAPRFFSAFGRDVDVPEGSLTYDDPTGRLTYAGGTRKQAKADKAADAALPDVIEFLGKCEEPISGTAIREQMKGQHPDGALRGALKKGRESKAILTQGGPRRAMLHYLNPSHAPSVSVGFSGIQCDESRSDECVSVSIGVNTLTHTDSPDASVTTAAVDARFTGAGTLTAVVTAPDDPVFCSMCPEELHSKPSKDSGLCGKCEVATTRTQPTNVTPLFRA